MGIELKSERTLHHFYGDHIMQLQTQVPMQPQPQMPTQMLMSVNLLQRRDEALGQDNIRRFNEHHPEDAITDSSNLTGDQFEALFRLYDEYRRPSWSG